MVNMGVGSTGAAVGRGAGALVEVAGMVAGSDVGETLQASSVHSINEREASKRARWKDII
jgi:uncharacterized protein (UPF0254 family)